MNDQDYDDFMELPIEHLNGASTAYEHAIMELEKKLKAIDINYNRDYDFLTVGEVRSLLESVIDYIRLKKIEMYKKI